MMYLSVHQTVFSQPSEKTMQKQLVTLVSSNAKTGPILVTTSPTSSCPTTCPFRGGGGCYAEYGPLAFLWRGLDRTEPGYSFKNGTGRVHVWRWDEMIKAVEGQRDGSLWRMNQAGDLPHTNGNISMRAVNQIIRANRGKRGFTYTHHSMARKRNREAVSRANRNGFAVNISANTLAEADAAVDLGVGPVVVVLPSKQREDTVTPKGRRVMVCPAVTTKSANCKSCGLCAAVDRDFVIGFPAHGSKRKVVDATVTKH